jgi:glucosamine--fructose-6-phosphate aminotransferase (isomerizing)
MLEEICAQPQAIRETIQRHVAGGRIFAGEVDCIENTLLKLNKIIIAASGSSRHAGLAAEIMIEDMAGIAVDVEYASEYCYRSTHTAGDALVIVITQSGETADTIAAQREARLRGAMTLAICNVRDATIGREASATLLTYAGPEMAVPATKSFTSQLAVLHLLALFLAGKRGRMTSQAMGEGLRRLLDLPQALQKAIPQWDSAAAECALDFRQAQTFLYLGRGVHYAIAREGALKLKETAYVQAEGYPAGELKHGPYALLAEKLPVVVIATQDRSDPDSVLRYQKTLAVMEDIRAHGGKLIVVATEGDEAARALSDHVWFVPAAVELALPILEVVPLQLLAYHIAVSRGHDVDHPRNLVKAVVTE